MEDYTMESEDAIVNHLVHAIDFANVMRYSLDVQYRPIADTAVLYAKHLNVEVVKCGSHAEKMYLPYFSFSNHGGDGGAMDASTDIDMMFVFDSYKIISDTQFAEMNITDPNFTGLGMMYGSHFRLSEAPHAGYYYILPCTATGREGISSTPTVRQIQEFGLSSDTLKQTLEHNLTEIETEASDLVFLATPTINGPSVTFQSRENSGVLCSIDCVFGVRCSTWPKMADAFFTRERTSKWPDSTVIEDIRRNGCHLVATGSHGSELRPYEWRLSSTAAEKMLALTLTDKQRLLYQIVKSLIKSEEKTKCIASYYIKTALFWLCEERPAGDWSSSSHLESILSLLQTLITFYTNKTVPNYFINKNNLIDHFDDEIIAQALHGLTALTLNLSPKLAQLLQTLNVMPVEFTKTPNEMLLSGNMLSLLQYFCVNFIFASIVYTLVCQIEEGYTSNAYMAYLRLAHNLYKHFTCAETDTASHRNEADMMEADGMMEVPPCKKSRFSKHGTHSQVSTGDETSPRECLHSAMELLEHMLQYCQSRESDMKTIWKLCIEPANIACTILCGYLKPKNAGEAIVDDCMHLLECSTNLHHTYSIGYTEECWKQYPQYSITPSGKPHIGAHHFLEMFVIILIKYQNENYRQFGIIGRGNRDTMRFPVAVRTLLLFEMFYDSAYTWVLLQINSALFGGNSISDYLRLLSIKHPSQARKIFGLINLTKMKLRAKVFNTDREKGRCLAQLGNLCHVKFKLESDSEMQASWIQQSCQHFRDALQTCPPGAPVKVDFASVLLRSGCFQEGLKLLTDVMECETLDTTFNTYDADTCHVLPDDMLAVVAETVPVSVPTVVLASYLILSMYKTVKLPRNQALFNQICTCLKMGMCSSDNRISVLVRKTIENLLSY